MENKRINKNANNIMWVEYWINKAHPSFKDYELYATKYDESRWICEIDLPLINKKVSAISNKEVNAMINASEKAAKLIDEYMKEHPELKIKNRFKGKRWEIVSDENGKYLSIGMSSAWRREQGRQMEKMNRDSIKTINEAINKLAKINGTSKNLYIQVVDKSQFGSDKSIPDIMSEINHKIGDNYYLVDTAISYSEDGNSVIVIGYTFPNKE